MNGPDCPVHKKPMDWLSTWNQWTYYCKQCDKRYNEIYQTMGDDYRAEMPKLPVYKPSD